MSQQSSLSGIIRRTIDGMKEEDAKNLLKSIRILASKTGESIERSMLLTFTLIATFILIDSKSTTGGSFLGLDFDNLTPIGILLPITISYTYIDLVTYISKAEKLSKMHSTITEKLFPNFAKNNLTDNLIFVPSIFEYKYFDNPIAYWLWRLFFFATLLSPILFVSYSINRMVNWMQVQNYDFVAFTWISIFISSLFTLQGILTLWYLLKALFKRKPI